MGYRDFIRSKRPVFANFPGEASGAACWDYGTGDLIHAKPPIGFASGTITNISAGPGRVPVGQFTGSAGLRYSRTGTSPAISSMGSTVTHEAWFNPTNGNPAIESSIQMNVNYSGGWWGSCMSLRGANAALPNNSLFICGTDGVGFNTTWSVGGILTTGVWHHIIASFTNSGPILCWVDGVRVDSSWTSGAWATGNGQMHVWTGVMNTNTGLDRYAEGYIMLGATYSFVFNQAQAMEHYRQGLNELGGSRIWTPSRHHHRRMGS
jgi:Concanavalin A-like lectin/glucanases superfamily